MHIICSTQPLFVIYVYFYLDPFPPFSSFLRSVSAITKPRQDPLVNC